MAEPRFIGMEEMTVDEKGRVGIPAKFMAVLRQVDASEELRLGMVLTPENSIKLMPYSDFVALQKRWDELDDAIEEERILLNMGPMWADEAALDKQNRIRLSPLMQKRCGVQRDVVVTGNVRFMQIFSREAFEALQAGTTPEKWSQALSRAAGKGREPQPVQYVINATPARP